MRAGKPGIQFNTANLGLGTVFKEYQEIIMKYIWTIGPEGVGTGKLWVEVNKVLIEKGESKSRASVIFFLQDMSAQGYLTYITETGKGGHRRIYTCPLNESEFKELIAKTVIDKLLEVFPEETAQALKEIVDTHQLSVD